MNREEFLQEYDKLDAETKLKIYYEAGGKITPTQTPFMELILTEQKKDIK